MVGAGADGQRWEKPAYVTWGWTWPLFAGTLGPPQRSCGDRGGRAWPSEARSSARGGPHAPPEGWSAPLVLLECPALACAARQRGLSERQMPTASCGGTSACRRYGSLVIQQVVTKASPTVYQLYHSHWRTYTSTAVMRVPSVRGLLVIRDMVGLCRPTRGAGACRGHA